MNDLVQYDKPKEKGERELTPKQKAFLTALAHPQSKGNIREAMNMAGYSANTTPDDVLSNIGDEIVKVANDLLAQNSVKAVVSLIKVLDNPAIPGANSLIAASKELMDRVGMIKKDQSTGTVIKADNVFILPPKDTPRTREIEGFANQKVIDIEQAEG
jgi:hypothetical protein